ncbi:unnamed protein product [Ectocarpus sp. 12 AP-2014]
MSVQLLGKRELKRLSSVANDGAGAGYSGFAKGMMAKMGWAEGQGLGKEEQGRSTYVQVKKKDDNSGLGKEKAQQNKVNDQWYFNAFDSALANMGGKKKKKKKDKKKRDKTADGEGVPEAGAEATTMYDKMFKATGGARMGMRARASQNGKLSRTEGGQDGTGGGTPSTAPNGSINGAIGGEGQGSSSHKRKRSTGTEEVETDELPKVVVKREKTTTTGEETTAVAAKGVGEAKKADSSTKAERKRERSEAKKAKRAAKAAQNEEARVPVAVKREENVEEGGASGKEKEKARKKKQKRAKKGA